MKKIRRSQAAILVLNGVKQFFPGVSTMQFMSDSTEHI